MTRAVSVAGLGGVGGGASVVAGQAEVESSGPHAWRQWWHGIGRQGRRGVRSGVASGVRGGVRQGRRQGRGAASGAAWRRSRP